MTDFEIADYEPIDPSFKLDIHAFWIVPDKSAASGHRSVPIPDEQFMAFLSSLDD